MSNILVIEDHFGIVEGYRSIFKANENINIEWASSLDCAYNYIMDKDYSIDLIILDIVMPSSKSRLIESGRDLGQLIVTERPKSKLMVVTSHHKGLIIYSIIKELNPIVFLNKSDFDNTMLLMAYEKAIANEVYYSSTVKKAFDIIVSQAGYFDPTNQKIITLLNDGVKTKNLALYLNLSLSAIDKRKASIKDALKIKKGTDEDIVRQARIKGLI